MMQEIGSAMSIAGRVGYQVGRQLQVDSVINEWANHANSYKVQRDEAWHQIRSANAHLTALKKENERLLEDLARANSQLKAVNKTLEVRCAELKVAKLSASGSGRRAAAAMQQINELKISQVERRDHYLQHLESVKSWGVAGIARSRARTSLVQALGLAERRILLLLTREIERACPTLQLAYLDPDKRRKIRMQAWVDGGGPALGATAPSDLYLTS
jgi:hypothetical protein